MPQFTNASDRPGKGGPNDVPRDGHDRYLIPRYPLDGPMAPDAEPIAPSEGDMLVPYTRVSTVAKTVQDTFGIDRWEKRRIVKGLGIRPDLYILAAATPMDEGRTLDSIAAQAKDAAEARAASNLGTALHSFTDQVDSGLEPMVPPPYDADIAAYRAALAQNDITLLPGLQEQRVILPQLADGQTAGAAGTFDRIVSWKQRPTVGDLKTGNDPLTYGDLEISIQLWSYANAWAMWDGQFFRPMPADLRQDEALVFHLAAGKAVCKVYAVDLSHARRAVELAMEVRRWRRLKGKLHRALDVVSAPMSPNQSQNLTALQAQGQTTVTAAATGPAQYPHQVVTWTGPEDATTITSPPGALQVEAAGPVTTPVPPGVLACGPDGAQTEITPEVAEVIRAMTGKLDDGRTPQQIADQELREQRQEKYAAEGWDGGAHQEQERPDPAQLAQLAPLAGPGERGCSVCGRKGHRKGSPKCLGTDDPRFNDPNALNRTPEADQPPRRTMGLDDVARMSSPPDAPLPDQPIRRPDQPIVPEAVGARMSEAQALRERAAHLLAKVQKACAHGPWTALPDGAWKCEKCGAPSPTGPVTEADGQRHPVVSEEAVKAAEQAERARFGGHLADCPIVTTPAAKATSATRCTCGKRTADQVAAAARTQPLSPGGLSDDPFADAAEQEGIRFGQWLQLISAATSPAEIREVRSQAMNTGEWTDEMLQAGLKRLDEIKSAR